MVTDEGFSSTLFPFNKEWQGFFESDPDRFVRAFTELPATFFERSGEIMTLSLFREMARRVPAYCDFLRTNKIDPAKIRSLQDLKHVPWIDKDNYLNNYPLSALCWDGKLSAPIISCSSGSTGDPFFWPRSSHIELETTYIYELFLRYFFDIDKLSTLLINGFSMGLYVAGTFTLNCCMRLAQKGYPLTIITPGVNKEEYLRIAQRLFPHFGQVILAGYPAFTKDILEEGESRGIRWGRKKIRLLFGGEGFTENWRSYVYRKAGITPKDYLVSSMNTYGSADAAILGHETPLSIFVRRTIGDDPSLCERFFGERRLPSIEQYYPFLRFFETEGNELIFSARTCIPLLRYNIHDHGSIISFSRALEILTSLGYSSQYLKEHIDPHLMWHLPFVYLFGRSDSTATFYGLKVYPENVGAALETKALRSICSGKFLMSTEYRKNQEQYLLIDVELSKNVEPTRELCKNVANVIVRTLRTCNLEYNHLYESIGGRAMPKIEVSRYGEKSYLTDVAKQKLVLKNS